ncbi:MAG: phosphate signaling complex protein PhoU [Proteobacteria bacterium]|nr:phosphate signaling complex protein PhoU [Pseudomonadota bacterium]
MTKHFDRDLRRLGQQISELGQLVVEASDKAIVMLQNFDLVLAEEILATERRINDMEVDIEEECLKIMALHQPVASDLRYVITILKVNNDLERMGDQVVNIAERVKFIADKPRVVVDVDFRKMSEISSRMVRMVLDALVREDAMKAREVLAMDDDLDALHARSFSVLQEVMARKPEMIAPGVSYLTISSNLERIGDLATNIAEDIIFMEEGEVVRHLPAPSR